MRRAFLTAGEADALAAWLQCRLNEAPSDPPHDAARTLARMLADPSVHSIQIGRKPSEQNRAQPIGVIRQLGGDPYTRTRIGQAVNQAEARALAGDRAVITIRLTRIAGERVWLLETKSPGTA